MKKSGNRLGVIFAVVFIDLLGFSFILPLYPEIVERFGFSATLITLLAASYALMQLVFSPILGRLSDKIGRKPVLLISTLGSTVAFIFFGLAGSGWLLFVSRIFNGIFGSSVAVAQAYIADVTGKEERTEGMGLVSAALGLGLIFGPALSGFLGRFGFGVPAFGAAAASFVNAILIIFFLKESLRKEFRVDIKISAPKFNLERFKEVLYHPLMSGVLMAYFLATLALAAIQNIAIFFAEERFHLTVQESGHFFAFIGMIIVLTQILLVNRLVKSQGESMVVFGGILLTTIGYFLVPLIEYVGSLVIMGGVIAVGAGLYIPAINSLVSKNASRKEQGEIFGLSQSLIGLALVAGPIIGGFLFDDFGSGSPFFAAGIMTLGALYFAGKIFKKLKHVEERLFFRHNEDT